MNKELREDLEHIIICKDKTITQDLRDDVEMTLDYIDELENKINKAIEYINNCEWEDYPLQIAGYHKLKEEKIGEDLLDILRGKDNENRNI